MSKKKKKKKPSVHQLTKIARARHKNAFFKIVSKVLKAAYCPNLFNQLSKDVLEQIYASRLSNFRLNSGNKEIKPSNLKQFTSDISRLLSEKTISLGSGGPKLTVAELSTVGFSIYLFFKRNDQLKARDGKNILEKLNLLEKAFTRDYGAGNLYYDCINSLLQYESNYQEYIYWPNFSCGTDPVTKAVFRKVVVNSYKLPQKKMLIDGYARKVMQVGWVSNEEGFIGASFYPHLDDRKTFNCRGKIKIYIQSHAINRMEERIGEQYKGHLLLYLWESSYKVKKYLLNKNKIFIEYNLFGIKLGYLVGDIIYGKLIIRTFLFLTNSGTPEGESLKELTGLNKIDSKYLGIDKLSTLINSDIKDDPHLKEIFEQAGIGHLFEPDTITALGRSKNDVSAARIKDYINTDQPEVYAMEESDEKKQGKDLDMTKEVSWQSA